jgi:hypothetical protein
MSYAITPTKTKVVILEVTHSCGHTKPYKFATEDFAKKVADVYSDKQCAACCNKDLFTKVKHVQRPKY